MLIRKLTAMQRLTTLLEGITTFEYQDASGTHTATYDLTGRVYRGRKTVSVEDAKESMSILEAPRATIGDGVGPNNAKRKETWTLNVQGWPVEDRINPGDPAYVMGAAVVDRLSRIIATKDTGLDHAPSFPGDYMLGGIVADMAIGSVIVSPATEGLSAVAFFYIPVVFTLVP